MAILVAVFALIVAWLALVRSRQAEETTQQLRRNNDKLIQRQQQILRELYPEDYAGSQSQTEPEVEEIEMTAPAREATPEAQQV